MAPKSESVLEGCVADENSISLVLPDTPSLPEEEITPTFIEGFEPHITKRTNREIIHKLREQGWNNGFYNPFADNESRVLENKLDEAERANLSIRRNLERETTYVGTLKETRKNLLSCITLIQDLANSKEQEWNRERIHHSEFKRTVHYWNKDFEQAEKDLNQTRQRNRQRLNYIARIQKTMRRTIQVMENDDEFLDLIKQKQQNATEELEQLSKLQSIDKETIQKMGALAHKLELENENLRTEVDKKVGDTKRNYEHYRQLSIDFRTEYHKRKEILGLWNTTVMAVKMRDSELQQISAEYYTKRELIATRTGMTDCVSGYLERRLLDIHDINYGCRKFESQISHINDQIDKANHHFPIFEAEQALLVTGIHKSGQQLNQKLQQIQKYQHELRLGVKKLLKIKDEISILHENHEKARGYAYCQDEIVKDLESMLEAENQKYEKLETNGGLIRKYLFEKQSFKTEVIAEMRMVQTRNSNVLRGVNRVVIQERNFITTMSQKQSRLYHIDLHLSNMELKISRILNSTVEPGYFDLRQRQVELSERREELEISTDVLRNELERNTIQRLSVIEETETVREEAEELQVCLMEARLTCKDTQRYWDGLAEDIKNLKVIYHLKLIRTTRMQSQMKFYSRKSRKILLKRNEAQTMAAERKAKIHFAKELMTKKIFLIRKDKSFLETNLSRMKIVEQKFKRKFDYLTGMKTNEDEETRQKNVMQEMMKTFEERAKLMKLKTHLICNLEREETETVAMVNVLEIMRYSNESYYQGLKAIPKKHGDKNQFEHLDNMRKRLVVYRNRVEEYIGKLQDVAKALTFEIDNSKKFLEKGRGKYTEKLRELSHIEQSSRILRDRMDRWDQLISRASKEQPTWEEGLLDYVQLSIHFKVIEQKFELALRKILKLMSRDFQLRKRLYIFLKEHNMLDLFLDRLSEQERALFEMCCQSTEFNATTEELCRVLWHDLERHAQHEMQGDIVILPSELSSQGEMDIPYPAPMSSPINPCGGFYDSEFQGQVIFQQFDDDGDMTSPSQSSEYLCPTQVGMVSETDSDLLMHRDSDTLTDPDSR